MALRVHQTTVWRRFTEWAAISGLACLDLCCDRPVADLRRDGVDSDTGPDERVDGIMQPRQDISWIDGSVNPALAPVRDAFVDLARRACELRGSG
jgi:hypothetical protein